MGTKKERAALTPEQIADAKRLRAKWDAFKAQDPKVRTQEWLANECSWGTQGAATQYLNGIIPLNLTALLKFADAIKFAPGEVSPSLAKQLAKYVVTEPPRAYSKEAEEAAKFVEGRPPSARARIVIGLKLMFGHPVSDAAVVAASGDFIAPNSPLKLRQKKK